MNNKVLVAFAMKEEFAPWRRCHGFHRVSTSPTPISVANFGGTEVYVALVGAGAVEAGHLRDFVAQYQPAAGIVTGVAAGLKPDWRPGDVLTPRTVCAPEGKIRVEGDVRLIDLAAQCGARRADRLVTLPRIVRTVAEKEKLAALADAADMESLPLMDLWSSCGIPALALRVILDPVEMPMTCDFEAAMDSHGQVRITKILAELARHPGLLPDFLHLARQSRWVMRILARFLDRFIVAVK